MNEKQPPYVCHVNDNIEDAIYIGRENGRKGLKRSKWANPFLIGKNRDRAEAVESFEWWVRGLWWDELDRLHHAPPSLMEVSEFTGKPLACWCRRSDEPRTDDNMCHGDVLVTLWKEQNHEPS